MSFPIRPAQRKDAETIARFQVLMAQETEGARLEWETVQKGVSRVFDQPEHGFYLVAERDDQILACTLLTYEWSDWRNGQVLWIQSVYVLSEHRGKGIFPSIFSYLQQLVFESKQYVGLRLYVDKKNHAAKAVYQKLGMDSQHYELFEWMPSSETKQNP